MSVDADRTERNTLAENLLRVMDRFDDIDSANFKTHICRFPVWESSVPATEGFYGHRFWSMAALRTLRAACAGEALPGRKIKGLIQEHVVPRQLLIDKLLRDGSRGIEAISAVLACSVIAVITEGEDEALNKRRSIGGAPPRSLRQAMSYDPAVAEEMDAAWIGGPHEAGGCFWNRYEEYNREAARTGERRIVIVDAQSGIDFARLEALCEDEYLRRIEESAGSPDRDECDDWNRLWLMGHKVMLVRDALSIGDGGAS